jgi:hypothetical protein
MALERHPVDRDWLRGIARAAPTAPTDLPSSSIRPIFEPCVIAAYRVVSPLCSHSGSPSASRSRCNCTRARCMVGSRLARPAPRARTACLQVNSTLSVLVRDIVITIRTATASHANAAVSVTAILEAPPLGSPPQRSGCSPHLSPAFRLTVLRTHPRGSLRPAFSFHSATGRPLVPPARS